jgi:hypothetical protein
MRTYMHKHVDVQAGLQPSAIPQQQQHQQQQHKPSLSPVAAVAHQRLLPDSISTSDNSGISNTDVVPAVALPVAVSLPQSPSIRGERGVEASKRREGMRKNTEVYTT